jgi:hypothetical protein
LYLAILRICGINFKFENLGEYKLIKNIIIILGRNQETRWVLFMIKKTENQKSHASLPLMDRVAKSKIPTC